MDEHLRNLERRAQQSGDRTDWAALREALRRAQSTDWLSYSNASLNAAADDEPIEMPSGAVAHLFSTLLEPYINLAVRNPNTPYDVTRGFLNELLTEQSRSIEQKSFRLPADMLASAASIFFYRERDFTVPDPEHRVPISREFLAALIEEIDGADLFCDHGVGICACGALQTLHELRLAIDNRQTCPLCGGERVVFAGMIDPGDGYDLYENYVDCQNCNAQGTIPL